MSANLRSVATALHRAPAAVVRAGFVEEDERAAVGGALSNAFDVVRGEDFDSAPRDGREALADVSPGPSRLSGSAVKRRWDIRGRREQIHDVNVFRGSAAASARGDNQAGDGLLQCAGIRKLAVRGRSLKLGEPRREPATESVRRREGFRPITESASIGKVDGDRTRVEPPVLTIPPDPLACRYRSRHVTIIVGYMANSRVPTPTGLTRDAGWEVGVRRTVNAPLDLVWTFLLGVGLPLWLGNAKLTLEKGASYETDDDIRGTILSYTEGTRIRLSWQPGEWSHDSTLQLTVKEAVTGTTIGFHQERLSGREERKIMLGHWKDVVQELDDAIAAL
jgi:uncharacterized protein YndB with AHSA1/START domain